jgi:predicted nucleic acid-binding protein
MIVVDASVIVSRLIPDDVNHSASRDWLTQHIQENIRIVAPIILLAEVGGAVARRTGSADAQKAVTLLQRIPRLRLVPIEARLGRHAAQLAIQLNLRGADAIYVAVAHRLGIPLVSWDGEHRNRAGTIITVQLPTSSA